MSRKNRIPRSSKRPSRSRGGTILGVFVGMILGAIIVTGAAWLFLSQTSSTKQAATSTAAAQPGAASTPNGTATEQTNPAVAALPGKPGDRPVEKPDFTFFNNLPSGDNASATPPASSGQEQTRLQPQTQTQIPPDPPALPMQTALEKQVYLQLAAFENAEQADDLRVRLLLMGLDRIVTQRAQLSDGRVVHRIRVGPFTDREDLKAMRARLVSSGLSADEVSN